MRVFFAEAVPLELALRWADGLWSEKRARVLRMRHDSDKALALTAHRLLCYAVKTVHGLVLQPENFALEPQGKPYLSAYPDIHFSISHSGSMAMCALDDSPVGADIEKLRDVGAGVAERVMTADELRVYANTSDKQSFFFQVWTLKEAYIKYRGEGLSLPMRSFSAQPLDGCISTDTGCEFWSAEPAPGYQAAVCARHIAHPQAAMVHVRQLERM